MLIYIYSHSAVAENLLLFLIWISPFQNETIYFAFKIELRHAILVN